MVSKIKILKSADWEKLIVVSFLMGFFTFRVLSVSFDGWKGNQRWISVYLTRKDYRLTNVLGDLKLQCEFAVIGKGGRKLFKKGNITLNSIIIIF